MIIDTSAIVSAVERKSRVATAAIKAHSGPSDWSFIVAGELAFGVDAAAKQGLPTADQEMRAATSHAYARLSEQPSTDTLRLVACAGNSFAESCSVPVHRKVRERRLAGGKVSECTAARRVRGARICQRISDAGH